MQDEIVEELCQCAEVINITDEKMMNIRRKIDASTEAPTEDEIMLEKLCKLDINLEQKLYLKGLTLNEKLETAPRVIKECIRIAF